MIYVGEGFEGSGGNAAHINLLLGPKDGPIAGAWATAAASPGPGGGEATQRASPAPSGPPPLKARPRTRMHARRC